jgi:hypothetical protein
MENRPSENHGEGNPEAADRFNTAERGFVNSARGKQKIQEGAQVRPDEQADLASIRAGSFWRRCSSQTCQNGGLYWGRQRRRNPYTMERSAITYWPARSSISAIVILRSSPPGKDLASTS